jgi:hypothetical protein
MWNGVAAMTRLAAFRRDDLVGEDLLGEPGVQLFRHGGGHGGRDPASAE